MATAQTRHNSNTPQEVGLPPAIWFIIASLFTLAYWSEVRQLVPGLADPPIVQSLGNVVETSFIGGLGTRTQVRTNHKTVLLVGAVEVEHGVAVERHSTPISEKLCVVNTGKCYDISSR